MHKLILILGLFFAQCAAHGQDVIDYSVLGNCVDAYFEAASKDDSTARSKAFSELFTPNGQVTAVLLKSGSNPRHTSGDWEGFLQNSISFYENFNVKFEEETREVEYYLDMASVHCLAYQYSTEKKTGKEYYQRLWMQFDLIFINGRWQIDNVAWVNEWDRGDIDQAMYPDTLWHRSK